MKDLITEARELCEKATSGPWTRRDVTDDSKYFLSAKDLVSKDYDE